MLTANWKFAKTIVMAAFLLAIFTGAGTAHASEITPEKMIELTNRSRSEAGLNSLAANAKLALAAQKKAADMFVNQYFEHVSPDGVAPWHWFDVADYDYRYAAENLAIDFITAEGAHSAFMKSKGHRENILGANYKEVGIAVVAGNFNGRNSIIIVEEFGTSKDYSSNTDPFFEAPESVEAEAVQKTAITIAENSVSQNANAGSSPVGQGRYGKIITQTYSVRDYRQLKKVYAEDIYWKQTEAGRMYYQYLTYGKAKLKYTLRNLTHGQCCTPLSK